MYQIPDADNQQRSIAATLLEIISGVTRRDMAHVAEYILPLRDEVLTRTVDFYWSQVTGF